MTLDLLSRAFHLLIENPFKRNCVPIQNTCLTRAWPLGCELDGKISLFHRRINITFISYPLMADIDECAQVNGPCKSANSKCKNTVGSFHCQCKDGFVKNGDDCEGTVQCNFVIFILRHYLLLKAHSFAWVTLSENCSLLGPNNVQGQIHEHINVLLGICKQSNLLISVTFACFKGTALSL